MESWIRLERRALVEDRWLTLYADRCRLPSGAVIAPFYVMEEKEWVQVVAVNEDGAVLITRQYRYAANVVCCELPCGAADEDEAPLAAAQRELKEETGFEADEWIPLATMFANPARQTNRIHGFIARRLKKTGPQQLDISEDIVFEFMPRMAVKRLIQSGEFSQAVHVATFMLASDFLEAGSKG